MNRKFVSLVAALALSSSVYAFAADDKPADTNHPAAKPAQGNGNGGGGGGGQRGPGGGGLGRMATNVQDPTLVTVIALGDLNLTPDFQLTADQKTKLQAIRDDTKKTIEKWKTDHEADIKKIQDEVAAAQQNQDRQAFGTIMQERQTLMATAPKGDDAIKQIKALLTEDQQKKLDDKVAELEKDYPMLTNQGRGPGGPGGGGPGGGGFRRNGGGGGGQGGGQGGGGGANGL